MKKKKTNLGVERLNQLFATMLDELKEARPPEPERAFAVERLVQRMRKRARVGDNPSLQKKAIDDFIACNDAVKKHRVSFDPDVLSNAKYFLTTMLERFTTTFDGEAIQCPLEMSFLWDHWRFGPGASNEVRGTHAVEKIIQDMTCTARCEPLVRKLRYLNPYFVANDSVHGLGTVVVSGSRLATVPKNEDTLRTIAIEPSGNMCLQLAAGAYIEGALRKIGLDIRNQQPKNKLMAQRGSIDGSVATIDLKAASDMISIRLVRELWPPEWFWLLCTLRSSEIKLPDGTQHSLNMISTMGNGFTFPLMTMTIVALIYGLRATRNGPNLFIDWTNTCVFGDDIIVPVEEYEALCDVLTKAGFVVNHDKSFRDGPFRESCGGDYYEGYDVTPFYVKSVKTVPDIYVVLNQVLAWSGRHRVYLVRTIHLLRFYLDEKVLLVPEWMNSNQGVQTSQCSRRYKYLSVTTPRKRHVECLYTMMLCVGGYIEGSGPDMFYTPRSERTKVCVRSGRLPKGFRSGWDPLTRSQQLSDVISFVVEVTLR